VDYSSGKKNEYKFTNNLSFAPWIEILAENRLIAISFVLRNCSYFVFIAVQEEK